MAGVRASDFFTLPASLGSFARFFSGDLPPWEWVARIAEALREVQRNPDQPELPPGVVLEGPVWLDRSVKLPPQAVLVGPAYVGAGTEIRPGAFLRGNVIIGQNAVVGHAAELKNALLLDGVQAAHRPYIADSVLGNGAHLGAGAVLSNLRFDQAEVMVRTEHESHATGLRKLGAMLGDRAEVGCNAVLQPGTLLGKRAMVLPCMAFGGYLAPDTLAKVRYSVVRQLRRD